MRSSMNASKAFVSVMASLLISFAVFSAEKGSGTGCNSITFGPQGYTKAAQLGDKVMDYLESMHEQNDATVALLGRIGSDSPQERFQRKVSQYWRHTHAGLAYRNHKDGRWQIVHLLNNCGKESSIYAESMMKFFLDDPFEYRAVVAIPSKDIQKALESIIVERDMALALFNDSIYSSVSYPFNTQRQNSNEYILDTLVTALAYSNGIKNIFTREQAKSYLLESQLTQFIYSEQVKVKGLESLGMAFGFGPKNASLDDHPKTSRRKGKIDMVSVGTLILFLENMDKLQSVTELSLSDVSKATDTVHHQ